MLWRSFLTSVVLALLVPWWLLPKTAAAAPATRLMFFQWPGNTPAGVAFAQQPLVIAVDGSGNLDNTYFGTVTLSIKPATGTPGAVLGGVLTVNAIAGLAIFSGLNIDRIGTGYQLTAGAAGLSGAESDPFNITADRLRFTTSPSNSTAGAAFPTQPVLQAVDSFGTLDTSFNSAVTVAIKSGTGTAGATLSGTDTVNAVAGVADFTGSGLNINLAGTAYQLVATSGPINSTVTGDSALFTITPGAATQLLFATSPNNSTAGVAFSTQPVVQARDAFGNLDTSFGGAVTVAINAGTGAPGATLGPPANLTVSAVNGVATFAGLNVDLAATGYRLTATSGALVPGDSNTFTITAGAASQLEFSTSPSSAQSGVAFPTQPIVQARDSFGNLADGFSGAVTLAIKSGTGTAGATLAGTTTVNASAGVATFSGLSIDLLGTGYQVTASSGALTPAESGTFNIAASGLVFTLQPVTTVAGQPLLVRVAAQDIAGNTDPGFTGAVTLTIQPGTGPAGATLGGTLTTNAVAGVADFTALGVNIDKVGTGYQLRASAGRSGTTTSVAFAIGPSSATQLTFTTSPSDAAAGAAFPTQPVVQARDQFGNLAAGFTGPVTVAIKSGTGTAGATLAGMTTVNAVNGIASFAGLSINLAGTAYQLQATSGALTPADSTPFAITSGAVQQLAFATSPSNATAGAAFPTQPVVRVLDQFGNPATTFSGPITLTIKAGTGSAGAVLTGTTTVNAVNGVATFSGLSINLPGTAYRLRAASGALTLADSTAFDVTGIVASRLAFTTQPPSSLPLGQTFAITVAALDGVGATDTRFTGPVTVAIKAGTGTTGATLSGTTTVHAVRGIATLSDLRIDPAGTGYVLTATASGLTSADSTAITIVSPATVPVTPEPTPTPPEPTPTPPEPTPTSPAPEPTSPEPKEDSTRKPTKLQRLQSERSNQLGFDDERTEGNIVSVGRDEQGLYLIVANRDGNVRVDIICGATCPDLPSGGYVVIEGTKLDETHYIATAVSLEN